MTTTPTKPTYDEVSLDGEWFVSALIAAVFAVSLLMFLLVSAPVPSHQVYKKPRVCGMVWNTPEDPTHGVFQCWTPTPQEDDPR